MEVGYTLETEGVPAGCQRYRLQGLFEADGAVVDFALFQIGEEIADRGGGQGLSAIGSVRLRPPV